MQINESQFAGAYSAGRRVVAGELTIAAAVIQLQTEYEFNAGTARIYIDALRGLLSGTAFSRMISIEAMRFFLTAIRTDYGDAHLSAAIEAATAHRIQSTSTEGAQPAMRALLAEFELSLPAPADVTHAEFNKRVRQSQLDTSAARADRLRAAPRLPTRRPVVSWQYDRNPDVVAEVLIRAAGNCERCKNVAPFKRKSDGSPYLEVHHVVQLAQGGEDTIENAVALCPNCHRHAHFGAADV